MTEILSAGGDAIGVEDRVDVAESLEQGPQLLDVAHLGRVPVARHLAGNRAAVLYDVGAVLGEGPGHVLEQARAIPGLQRDRDAERARGRVGVVPATLGSAP